MKRKSIILMLIAAFVFTGLVGCKPVNKSPNITLKPTVFF